MFNAYLEELSNQLKGNFKQVIDKLPEYKIEAMAKLIGIEEPNHKFLLQFLANNWDMLKNRDSGEIAYDIAEPLKTYLKKNDITSLKKLSLKTLNQYKGIKAETSSGEKGLKVIKITDKNTCINLTKESGWCVQNDREATLYLDQGPLYLILKDGKRFALIHFKTSSFMDVQDNPLELKTIKYIFDNSDLKKYAPKGGIFEYLNNPNVLIDFESQALWLNGKEGEGEYKEFFGIQKSGVDLIYKNCMYKDGEKNGWYKQYTAMGKIKIDCFYKHDELDGRFKEYTPNGKLFTDCYYRNGRKHGPYKRYFHDTNQVQIDCNYENGKLDGKYMAYDHDGNVVTDGMYKNDNLVKINHSGTETK